MNVGAFVVLLAVGCANQHDTGRRMEIDVVAPSKLDAACIAENTGIQMVSDHEYVYAKRVRLVRSNPSKSSPSLAVAA